MNFMIAFARSASNVSVKKTKQEPERHRKERSNIRKKAEREEEQHGSELEKDGGNAKRVRKRSAWERPVTAPEFSKWLTTSVLPAQVWVRHLIREA